MGKRPQTEVVPIAKVAADAANLRRRDERARQTLKAAVEKYQPFRSIAVDGDLVTRAGSGTLEAARAAGVAEVLIVRPTPGQLVAVQRSDLSPDQLVAYAVDDNRTTDLSTFDEQGLAETLRSLQSEDFDTSALGYAGEEVDQLIEKLGDDMLEEFDRQDQAEEDENPGEFSPQLRYDLTFDSDLQEDVWLGFIKWLGSEPDYEAETIAGRLDLFLRGLG